MDFRVSVARRPKRAQNTWQDTYELGSHHAKRRLLRRSFYFYTPPYYIYPLSFAQLTTKTNSFTVPRCPAFPPAVRARPSPRAPGPPQRSRQGVAAQASSVSPVSPCPVPCACGAVCVPGGLRPRSGRRPLRGHTIYSKYSLYRARARGEKLLPEGLDGESIAFPWVVPRPARLWWPLGTLSISAPQLCPYFCPHE